MTTGVVEESAATAPDIAQAVDDSAGTGLSRHTAALLLKGRQLGRGPLMAAVVLSAALTSTAGMGITPVLMNTGRKRDQSVASESDTATAEVDPELVDQIRSLFDQGASEFFHDGVQSTFSRRLLAIVAGHGRAAFYAIADYLFRGEPNPDVVSEALRWLADLSDPTTFLQRWSILQRAIRDRSPRVRDGAILGFAALDDSRARTLLDDASKIEQTPELRRLIDQVLQQLDATTHASTFAPNRSRKPLV